MPQLQFLSRLHFTQYSIAVLCFCLTGGSDSTFALASWISEPTYSHSVGVNFTRSTPTISGLAAQDVTESSATIEALIKQLGDAQYSVRTQAESKLLSLGGQVIQPLRRAMTHRQTEAPDSEIRLRCTRLLILIERKVARKKIQDFLAGGSESLPGWQEFSNSTGDNKHSRKLFANVHKLHPQLFDAIQQGKLETEEAVQTIVKSNLRFTSNANQTIASLTAMMFASTLKFDSESSNVTPKKQSRIQISIWDQQRIQSVLTRRQMVDYLKSSGNKPQLDRLVSDWLDTIPDTQTANANIKLATILAYGLTKKIDVAVSLATDKKLAIRTRVVAMEVIAQLAMQDQIESLERLFDDQTTGWELYLEAQQRSLMKTSLKLKKRAPNQLRS